MKSIKIENLQGRIYTKSGIMSNSTFNCFIDNIRCKDCIFELKNGNCGGGIMI